MRRAIRCAIRLYPAAWRERYGAEFEALLEEVRPGGRELRDILRGAMRMQMTVWNWRRTAGAFALAGAIVAGVIALRTPREYVSTTVMRVAEGGAGRLQDAQIAAMSRTSLAQIIVREDLYHEERTRLPLEDIVMEMRAGPSVWRRFRAARAALPPHSQFRSAIRIGPRPRR
jgi:hypothetical protein